MFKTWTFLNKYWLTWTFSLVALWYPLGSTRCKHAAGHPVATEACNSIARVCVVWISRSSVGLSALCRTSNFKLYGCPPNASRIKTTHNWIGKSHISIHTYVVIFGLEEKQLLPPTKYGFGFVLPWLAGNKLQCLWIHMSVTYVVQMSQMSHDCSNSNETTLKDMVKSCVYHSALFRVIRSLGYMQ